MRILALTRYGPLGPSSRVRFYQYYPYLRQHGVDIQAAALLDDEYIRRLYSSKRASLSTVVGAYLQRLAWLSRSSSFDLLWIEKELLPWLPPWAERLLRAFRVPYVVDFDDALFHRYDLHSNPLVRLLLRTKIAAVMTHATTVVSGNDYLTRYARQAGARNIQPLPSVVDLDRYHVAPSQHPGFRIGWIGSPVTAPFVGLVRPALEQAVRTLNASIVLVGAGQIDPLPGLPSQILPWSAASEVTDIQSFDVGIMPLPDAPFERGKCGYKLIQYMACGLPVIASPTGANTQIVDHGKTGFLATTPAEWIGAIETLHHDPALRNEFGKAGRARVASTYSLQVAAPQLLEILQSAAL